MNSLHLLAEAVVKGHKQLRLISNIAYDVLYRPACQTTYVLLRYMLYKLRLQGCKVGLLEPRRQHHGDDVIRSLGMVDDINSTLLKWPADKQCAQVTGRRLSVSAIATYRALT